MQRIIKIFIKKIWLGTCLLLVVGAGASRADVNLQLEQSYLGDIQCKEQVFNQFSSLRVTRDWSLNSMRELDGSRRMFSPTEIVGVWVEAQVFMNKEVVLRRITEHFIEQRTFDLKTCAMQKSIKKQNSQLNSQLQQKSQYFSDRDLRSLIKSHQRGVIYVWSPNMPYSFTPLKEGVTGFDNIKAAAAEFDAHVTVLMDPAAHGPYALEIIKENKHMSEDFMRRAQSIELSLRSMSTHFPVVLVYADGKIARTIYPGIGTQAEYTNYIRGQFNEIQK